MGRTISGNDVSAVRNEMDFLQSLSNGKFKRKLKLEPGAVPIMVMWTELDTDSDKDRALWEKDRVDRTADFHRDTQSRTEVEVKTIDNDGHKNAELNIILNFFEDQIF